MAKQQVIKLYDEGNFEVQEFFSDELSRMAQQTPEEALPEPEPAPEGVIRISGWASRYRTEDGVVIDRDQEVTDTDSLSIKNFLKNPVILYNHDQDNIIGRATRITKSYEGIFIEAEIHRITGLEHVYEAVAKNLLQTFSIGFIPKAFDYDEDNDVLVLQDGDLFEVSVVSVPANAEAVFSRADKSLKVDRKQLAKQNGMSCDELKGQCSLLKAIKPTQAKKETDLKTKNTETPETEVKQPEGGDVTLVPAPTPEAKVEKVEKVEKPTVPNPAVLSAEDFVRILDERDKVKADTEAKAAAEAEAKAAADAEAEANKVPNALDILGAIKVADLNEDDLDKVYEVTSQITEQVEARVVANVQAELEAETATA